jgi:endonuclease YncB( thermonuclease family)
MARLGIIATATLLAWPVAAGPPIAAGVLSGPAHVLDGDTMAVGNVTIRINGIDAAELGQQCERFNGDTWACADAASDRLAELIGTSTVECETIDNDAYGRIIATCYVDNRDLGRQLVVEGLAWAFVKYAPIYEDQ